MVKGNAGNFYSLCRICVLLLLSSLVFPFLAFSLQASFLTPFFFCAFRRVHSSVGRKQMQFPAVTLQQFFKCMAATCKLNVASDAVTFKFGTSGWQSQAVVFITDRWDFRPFVTFTFQHSHAIEVSWTHFVSHCSSKKGIETRSSDPYFGFIQTFSHWIKTHYTLRIEKSREEKYHKCNQ